MSDDKAAQDAANYRLSRTQRGKAKNEAKDPEKEAEARARAAYAKVIGRPVGIADQAKFVEWRKKQPKPKPSAALQAEALAPED